MEKRNKTKSCARCKSGHTENYCSSCGRAQKLKRIDKNYVLSEITSVLNFDKGILFTVRELLIRPGQNIQKFIHNDRNRLVKPLIFVLVCSLIYTAALKLLHFEDGYVNAGGFGASTVASFFQWIQSNYGYSNILMAIFIAFWIKIFFRKYDYNFYEIIILLCFVMGMGMLIYTTFGILESLTKIKVLHFGGIFGVVYVSWAIGRFFDKSKKINYLKGILSYFLGMLTFFLGVILLGNLIDLIIK